MRRVYQATSLAFLALGVFLMWQGQALGLSGMVGPGPGFFPFWVGVALAALSACWFGQASLRPVERMSPDFMPGGGGMLRLAAVLIALVAFAIALKPLGFNLSMLGFTLFLFFVFGREYPISKIVIAIGASFGVHYVFETLLKLPLPYSSVDLLRSLGL